MRAKPACDHPHNVVHQYRVQSPSHTMVSVPRPEHRSQRRSRRRQFALVFGAMSYFAAFVAGVLALLSIAIGTGTAALAAALVAAGFIVVACALWAADHYARLRPRPPSHVHIA